MLDAQQMIEDVPLRAIPDLVDGPSAVIAIKWKA